MSYETTLRAEINKAIDAMVENGAGEVPATWIAHSVVNSHRDGLLKSEHSDFWNHNAYSNVRKMVTKVLNTREGLEPDQNTQARLFSDDYDHLRQMYVVRRNGDLVGVPLPFMSDDEIHFKADQMKRMGQACFDHADELYRYKSERIVAERLRT